VRIMVGKSRWLSEDVVVNFRVSSILRAGIDGKFSPPPYKPRRYEVMTEVIVPYGSTEETVTLDGTVETVLAYPGDFVERISSDSIVESIEKPLGKPPLRQFLSNSKNLLVVVNDGARRTPTAQILELISPLLEKTSFRVLIACGSHQRPRPREVTRILGKNYANLSTRVIVHDSKRTEGMVYLGRTRRGTELSINSLAIESDRILVITSVEPHYFAGFMGGRKSLVPGISSYSTIVQNHRLALHSMAKAFSLHRNPVNNDMMEIFNYLSEDKVFSIQLLQDRGGKITEVFSGDIQKTFSLLTESTRRLYGVKTGRRADILVSIVSDGELSLYESRKAIHYGILGLRKGGILIVVSPCARGLGSSHFIEPISASRTPQHLINKVHEDFQLGHQRLAKWVDALLWGEVWLVSDLPERSVTDLFFTIL